MASLSARTLPVALALALISAASVAEDRPNTTLVQKSKSSAVTPATTQKSRAQAPAQVNGGTAAVKAGSKSSASTTDAATPTAGRSYEGCQGKGGAEA
jgi:L,D-peptidoglycan transpeptidase YkuD (ErfK/YbiS/YcfS/YnhG family)